VTGDFLLPLGALFVVALMLGMTRWQPPAALAIRALALISGVVGATVFALVAATAAGFVLGPARQAEIVEWCRIIPLHHEVGPLLGGLALGALIAIMVRISLVVRRFRSATRATSGRRVSILPTSEPVAYAAPGRPGCVVVSTGLLAPLDARERQVVFAHERAHLRQGHHRYLLVGLFAAAVVPFLGPLVARLRLATERCADEEAVATLGGDRRLVARAIAKAALATSTYHHDVVPAFNGGEVAARVNALIGTPPGVWATRSGHAIMIAGMLSAIGAGSVQIHHLWVLIDHICHG
jgi:Zn-dependent protease with chaperone function